MNKKIIIIALLAVTCNFICSDMELNFDETNILKNGDSKLSFSDDRAFPGAATRGSVIEAIFILQNRRNYLSRRLQKCKQVLKESGIICSVSSKDCYLLSRCCLCEMQFKHFSFKRSSGYDYNKFVPLEAHILGALENISNYDVAVYRAKLCSLLYPEYLSQLGQHLRYVESQIEKLDQDGARQYKEVRSVVESVTLLQDIVSLEQLIEDLFYDVCREELLAKNINSNIHAYQYNGLTEKLKSKLSCLVKSINLKKNKLSESFKELYKLNQELTQDFLYFDNSEDYCRSLLKLT